MSLEASLDYEVQFHYHMPGRILTGYPRHQEVHVDDGDMLDNSTEKKEKNATKQNNALIYHVPLSKEGLQLYVAEQ